MEGKPTSTWPTTRSRWNGRAQPGQDGPWNFIGAPELPNTGKFTWRPGPTVPPNIYLRLTVRDTAGNKAVAQTPDAQLIDLSVPEVSNIGLGGVGGPVSVNSADLKC